MKSGRCFGSIKKSKVTLVLKTNINIDHKHTVNEMLMENWKIEEGS